ncbi:MAG: glycoside hydrolase family 97 protein [Chitinophagaceae bacterium]|nr:glycoside hydrolase family 97 protein [Chitinophagaceae bacterium]
MTKKFALSICIFLLSSTLISAQKGKKYEVKSQDENMAVVVETGKKLLWSVQHKGQQIIAPSSISLHLADDVLGDNTAVISATTKKVNTVINAINYKKASINDQYNELTLNCKADYGVTFRVYNDAVAYRFFTKKKGDIIVENEEANFNFIDDYRSFIPIQWDYRDGKNFNSSFEALYYEIKLSQFPKDSLAFLPLLVEAGQKKVVILEADLEDYPGMYLNLNSTGKGFKGVYAPYPAEADTVGINYIPTKREDYIARTTGTRNFPWRVIVISEQDKDLLNQDIVQKLAAPSRLTDISWIKTGLVAWDWWNARNISGVDFRAGMNTPTYKYFIDFAAANKIPYIILDGGWSQRFDLFKVNPNLNLPEIISYGKDKGVDIILWASWYAILQQMDKAFPEYSKMGVKGWKIDFIDRDDQVAVASTYSIARKAAEHKLLVDYHGAFKPTGLQRTYPNVIGYEGVKGLENYKWANEDQPRYTATIPFIRMMAGPMDYTPGAMRNATESNYRVISNNPMSKGTRCNQLAQYVIFESPLQMLSDNPTIYKREQECTNFISKMPTTFDETIALDGKVGEYAMLARRKGDTWFVGALSNWTPHEITLDFSFLPEGTFEAEIFKDGLNADRDATDYKREIVSISKSTKTAIKLYPGGGWAARIYKK